MFDGGEDESVDAADGSGQKAHGDEGNSFENMVFVPKFSGVGMELEYGGFNGF